MRADIIKLDRALVADVHADPAKVALIGSLVHFARSTGAAICAEGIETLEELRVLIHLGVAYGQGWALGRPARPVAARERRGRAALPRAALGAARRSSRSARGRRCGEGPSGVPNTLAVLARLGDDVRAHRLGARRRRPPGGARGRGARDRRGARLPRGRDQRLPATPSTTCSRPPPSARTTSIQQLVGTISPRRHLDAAADRALPPPRRRLLRPRRRVRLGLARRGHLRARPRAERRPERLAARRRPVRAAARRAAAAARRDLGRRARDRPAPDRRGARRARHDLPARRARAADRPGHGERPGAPAHARARARGVGAARRGERRGRRAAGRLATASATRSASTRC